MRPTRTKLPAFTIMETIIAMALTAILVGFIYMAYLVISQSQQSFYTRNNRMQTVLTLDKLLKKDFALAASVSRTAHQLVFTTPDSVHILYEFRADAVIRTTAASDTLPLNSYGLAASFEGRLTDSTAAAGTSRIDDLQFTVLLQKTKIPYHYHKLYSSENLFQPSSYAIH